MIDSYAKRTGVDVYTFRAPKDVMWKVAHAIKGKYGDPKVCMRTVVQFWKNLTAGWQWARRGKIKDEVVLSTSNLNNSTITSRLETPSKDFAVHQKGLKGRDGPRLSEAGKVLWCHDSLLSSCDAAVCV